LVGFLRRTWDLPDYGGAAALDACTLASSLASPDTDTPELILPIAADLARLMASAPGAMEAVAWQLRVCDVHANVTDAWLLAALVCNIAHAAKASSDGLLGRICAGAPLLRPAIARALRLVSDHEYAPYHAERASYAFSALSCALLVLACSSADGGAHNDPGAAISALFAAEPPLLDMLQRGVRRGLDDEDERMLRLLCRTLYPSLEGLLFEQHQEPSTSMPPPWAPPGTEAAEGVQAPQSTPQQTIQPVPQEPQPLQQAAQPQAQQPRQQLLDPQPRCGFCGTSAAAPGTRLRLCRGCRAAHFCSNACYKQGWAAGHRQACKAAQAQAQQVAHAPPAAQPGS
jgi:hypothetical protein